MPRQDSFVEYVVELLEPLGPVQVRGMFGGWGVYFGGRMFGLIADGQLYLKTDEVTRPVFKEAGCRPFLYEGARKPVELGYWTPPSDAADDAHLLLPWARRAVDAANRAALKKAPKKKAVAPAKKAAAKKAAPPAKKRPAAKKVATKKAAPPARKRPTAK